MIFRKILVIYRKELTDLLRDRRTLISMILVPILVGPTFTSALGWYLRRSRAAAKVETYNVGLQESTRLPGLLEALQRAGMHVQSEQDARQAAASKLVDFGVVVTGNPVFPKVAVYSDHSEMKMEIGSRRILDALDRLRDTKVRAELQKRSIPLPVLRPFDVASINTAQPRRMTGASVGTALSFVLLIFLFNGAMYSAVDMTAGEKERRTLEILLCSAASRVEIVCGKVLTAITTSIVTASLSIVSYVVAFSLASRADGEVLALPTDFVTLSLIGLSLLPIAVLSASVAVGLALPAKSTREAMSYLTPLLFVIMFFGLSTFVPELQKNALLSLVPVLNFARMLRQLLAGEWSWAQYAVTFAANLLYAALAIAFAVRKFKDESVLFRS